MRQALLHGRLIWADAAGGADGVRCPVCSDPVIYRRASEAGAFRRRAHFAHYPQSSCAWAQGEDDPVRDMLEVVAGRLSDDGREVRFEVAVRPDLTAHALIDGLTAVECVVSPMSLSRWLARTAAFAHAGIHVLWAFDVGLLLAGARSFDALPRAWLESVDPCLVFAHLHGREKVTVVDISAVRAVHLFGHPWASERVASVRDPNPFDLQSCEAEVNHTRIVLATPAVDPWWNRNFTRKSRAPDSAPSEPASPSAGPHSSGSVNEPMTRDEYLQDPEVRRWLETP